MVEHRSSKPYAWVRFLLLLFYEKVINKCHTPTEKYLREKKTPFKY